jgi:hypothetical protein
MGRVKLDNAKRTPIGVKVSDAVYEAIEAARGHLTRAEWLTLLIDAELARHREDDAGSRFTVPQQRARKAPAPPPVAAPAPVAPVPAHALGAAVFQAAGESAEVASIPDAPAAERPKCPHVQTRTIGGDCKQCGHRILPGGYWA